LCTQTKSRVGLALVMTLPRGVERFAALVVGGLEPRLGWPSARHPRVSREVACRTGRVRIAQRQACAPQIEPGDHQSQDHEQEEEEEEEEAAEERQHEERVLLPSVGTLREPWRY
jgi:hypothetical protein